MKHDPVRARLKLDGYTDEKIDAFFRWHDKHISMWKAFQKKAFELLNQGKERIGSKSLFEKLREDPTIGKIDEFKADNTFTAMWARCLTYKYPVFRSKILFKAVGTKIREAA